MKNTYCGLDFGTSNSTLGALNNKGKAHLLPLDSGKLTIPTSLFFHFETDEIFYGREAITEYTDGEFGRLMRSIKSILGTPLMDDSTQIKSKHYAFTDIISTFISEMKQRAESASGDTFEKVVMGRPVHFVDNNPHADTKAQKALEKAALKAGFKEVLFQYEPIAAALDYEQQVTKEEIALIVDLGGGTSDFSIVKISPDRAKSNERKEDILSNGGIHIGGTDFDRKLSLHSVMPEFGYRTTLKENSKIEAPTVYHHDLATWHKIHFLYDRNVLISLKNLALRVNNAHLIHRLIQLIEQRECHRLAIEVEKAKISLTTSFQTSIPLEFVEHNLALPISRDHLHDSIAQEVNSITHQVKSTVADAGLTFHQITKIFMTGGSTAVPLVRDSILALFPQTEIIDGDMFGSVGLGLTLDAQRKFK